jgi:hypothetical protein
MTLVGHPEQRFCSPKPCSIPATFHLLHNVTRFRFHCNDVPDNFNWIGFPMQGTYGMPGINFAQNARFRRSDTPSLTTPRPPFLSTCLSSLQRLLKIEVAIGGSHLLAGNRFPRIVYPRAKTMVYHGITPSARITGHPSGCLSASEAFSIYLPPRYRQETTHFYVGLVSSDCLS